MKKILVLAILAIALVGCPSTTTKDGGTDAGSDSAVVGTDSATGTDSAPGTDSALVGTDSAAATDSGDGG